MIRTMYISGPMTGIEEWNYPAFHAMASAVASAGWLPINPADNFGGYQDLPKELYMKMDLQHVLHSDAMILLAGWEQSDGARLEKLVAEAIGIPVFYAEIGIPNEMEVA